MMPSTVYGDAKVITFLSLNSFRSHINDPCQTAFITMALDFSFDLAALING